MTRMTLAERRQRLIAAALQVIGRRGVSAATTRAIAAEAGMPLASFHYAFDSHQVLMVEALREVVQQELALLADVHLTGETERDVVAAELRRHVDDVEQRMERHLTVLELCDHVSRVVGDADVVASLRQGRIAALERALEEHRKRPEVTFEHDSATLARMVVTLADGLTQTVIVPHSVEQARGVVEAWTAPLAS